MGKTGDGWVKRVAPRDRVKAGWGRDGGQSGGGSPIPFDLSTVTPYIYISTPSVYSGFNNAPHLHTGDVSITELLRIRYELDLTNERDIQIVLIDYNGKVRHSGGGMFSCLSDMTQTEAKHGSVRLRVTTTSHSDSSARKSLR